MLTPEDVKDGLVKAGFTEVAYKHVEGNEYILSFVQVDRRRETVHTRFTIHEDGIESTNRNVRAVKQRPICKG